MITTMTQTRMYVRSWAHTEWSRNSTRLKHHSVLRNECRLLCTPVKGENFCLSTYVCIFVSARVFWWGWRNTFKSLTRTWWIKIWLCIKLFNVHSQSSTQTIQSNTFGNTQTRPTFVGMASSAIHLSCAHSPDKTYFPIYYLEHNQIQLISWRIFFRCNEAQPWPTKFVSIANGTICSSNKQFCHYSIDL